MKQSIFFAESRKYYRLIVLQLKVFTNVPEKKKRSDSGWN